MGNKELVESEEPKGSRFWEYVRMILATVLGAAILGVIVAVMYMAIPFFSNLTGIPQTVIDERLSFSLFLIIVVGIIGSFIYFIVLLVTWEDKNKSVTSAKEYSEAKAAAKENPELEAIWDVAELKIQIYIDRNIEESKTIFRLTAFVMVMGFSIVLLGIILTFLSPDNLSGAIVAAVSGMITQFIGATFLFVYRTVYQLSGVYSGILERMNAVGMAVKIINTIPEKCGDDDLKSITKAKVSELLLTRTSVEKDNEGKDEKTKENKGK